MSLDAEPVDDALRIPLREWSDRMVEDLRFGVGRSHVFETAALFGAPPRQIAVVRRCVSAMLDAGGLPLRWQPERASGSSWWVADEYGATPEEVLRNIVAEWLELGFAEPLADDLWFGTGDLLTRLNRSLPSEDVRHATSGVPLSLQIARTPVRMDDIGVGIVDIAADGAHGFGLTGEALDGFVHESLRELVDAGGVPLDFDATRPKGSRWRRDPRCPGAPEDIVELAMASWRERLVDDPPWGEFWWGDQAAIDELNRMTPLGPPGRLPESVGRREFGAGGEPVTARRVLTLDLPEGPYRFEVRILEPRPRGEAYEGRVEIDWPDESWWGRAFGEDSVEALRLSLQFAGAQLDRAEHAKGGRIRWGRHPGHGFPVPPDPDLLPAEARYGSDD